MVNLKKKKERTEQIVCSLKKNQKKIYETTVNNTSFRTILVYSFGHSPADRSLIVEVKREKITRQCHFSEWTVLICSN
jgi:transposase InsO family protein